MPFDRTLIFLVSLPLFAVFLAGCTGGTPESVPSGDAPASVAPTPGAAFVPDADFDVGEPNVPGLPPNFTRRETVVAGVSALPSGHAGVCGGATNACYHTPFTTFAPSLLSARLTWLRELNDFDVHLYRDGVLLASSAQSGRGVAEAIDVALEPAEYDLVVVAWIVTRDAFTLAANFTVPPVEEQEDRAACRGKPLVAIGPIAVGGSDCRR